MEGVVSVFQSKALRLHTTRSWDFLGLSLAQNEVSPMQLTYGGDVVVGIFDTGSPLTCTNMFSVVVHLFFHTLSNPCACDEKVYGRNQIASR